MQENVYRGKVKCRPGSSTDMSSYRANWLSGFGMVFSTWTHVFTNIFAKTINSAKMFLPVHFRPRWIFLKKEKSVENLVTLSLDPRFLKILIHLGSLFICWSIFAQSFDFLIFKWFKETISQNLFRYHLFMIQAHLDPRFIG